MLNNTNYKIVKLKDSVTIRIDGTQYILELKEKRVTIKSNNNKLLNFFINLKNGFLQEEICKITEKSIIDVFNVLEENKFLCSSKNIIEKGNLDEKNLHWLNQFSNDVEVIKKTIKNSNIIIFGCGGTGTVVVQNLLGAGVENFILIDCDTVCQSNFNRQYAYSINDIGRTKTDSLKEYILSRNKNSKIYVINEMIQKSDTLSSIIKEFNAKFIFSCADYPNIQINSIVAKASYDTDTPCIFGAVGLMDGSIGPLLHGKTRNTLNYILFIKKVINYYKNCICDTKVNSSLGIVNSIVSTFITYEWFNFITGINTSLAKNAMYSVDLKTYKINLIRNF